LEKYVSHGTAEKQREKSTQFLKNVDFLLSMSIIDIEILFSINHATAFAFEPLVYY